MTSGPQRLLQAFAGKMVSQKLRSLWHKMPKGLNIHGLIGSSQRTQLQQ